MRWQGEWVERVRRGIRHLREGQKNRGSLEADKEQADR